LVSVLLSGRPMLIDDILEPSAAFIAAWLPGTSGGQGILNAITGDYLIRPNGTSSRINTLSVDWPRGMVNIDNYLGFIIKISNIRC
jgi:beta-glucosidase